MRSPGIEAAIMELHAAQERYREAIKREQEACRHPQVLQKSVRVLEAIGGVIGASRICVCCGLEEKPRNGGQGWSEQDYEYDVLKTEGFHKKASDSEFYAARLP